MNSKESLRFVYINGKGSSGKDTQAEALLRQYGGAEPISTGEIYRGARTPDGKYGKFHYLLAPYIESVDRGGFFPDEIMLEIVRQVIEDEVMNGNSFFVFTGFPRTIGQLEGVDEMTRRLSEHYEIDSAFVYLAVLDQQSRDRAANRRKEAIKRGETPRPDDEADVVEKRLSTFTHKTRPLIDRLALEKRLCIVRANRSIESVTDNLLFVLEVKE